MRLIFVRGATLSSALICLGTVSAWSHVAIVTPDGRGIIDATFKHGVSRRSLASFASAYGDRWVQVDVPVGNPLAAHLWLQQQLGKPYDWSAYAGFLWPSRRWQDDGAWFCSELAAGALAAAGHAIPTDTWRITPGMLLANVRGALA